MTELTEASTSKFARVSDNGRDLNIHYNEAGQGDVVIMLHGSGPGASGWSNFHRNIGPFVDAGYRVLLIDAPGWNKSDPVVCAESRPHLIARVVGAVMDKLDMQRAHFVGNSMGAVATIDFALSYPERANRLVLLGGGGMGPSMFNPMPMEGIKLIQRLYADPTMDNLMKMLDVFVYDPKQLSQDLIQGRHANIINRPEHLRNWLESFKLHPNQFPDLSPRVGEIEAPALAIWGRDDRFVPLDLGLRLLSTMKNAELHVFGQCGHWAQWEHASKFNNIALEFLKR
jgi:2-hydroxy-6-oxonona-2,4-dienedioate hydrolase